MKLTVYPLVFIVRMVWCKSSSKLALPTKPLIVCGAGHIHISYERSVHEGTTRWLIRSTPGDSRCAKQET